MSRKYYIKDENGTVLSSDGQTRFKVIEGAELYSYLQSEERKGKYFYCYKDDNDDVIGVECTCEQYMEFECERGRRKYLRLIDKEMGYEKVSLDFSIQLDDDDVSIIESIEDENADIEKIYDRQEMIEKIIEVLDSLSKEERDLITELYLSTDPKTEREYAEKIGITQPTVNYRKMRILEKIKKFL